MPSKKEKLGFRIEDDDNAIREWLRPFRDTGLFSGIMRLLIYERTGEPLPDDLEFLAFKIGPSRIEQMRREIEDVQAHQIDLYHEMQGMRETMQELVEAGIGSEAMTRLEQSYEKLAHKVDHLSARLDTMQLTGAREVVDDAPPLMDEDVQRQAVLSAKLKRVNFGTLTQ